MTVRMAPALVLVAACATASIPSDPRLAAVRADLARAVDSAERAGLLTDVLVAKIREGLAKKVPPHRILAVVHTLASELAAARSRAVSLMSAAAPQAALLRALVDAIAEEPTTAGDVDQQAELTSSTVEGTLDQALQHTHRDTPAAIFDRGLNRDFGMHNGKLPGAR